MEIENMQLTKVRLNQSEFKQMVLLYLSSTNAIPTEYGPLKITSFDVDFEPDEGEICELEVIFESDDEESEPDFAIGAIRTAYNAEGIAYIPEEKETEHVEDKPLPRDEIVETEDGHIMVYRNGGSPVELIATTLYRVTFTCPRCASVTTVLETAKVIKDFGERDCHTCCVDRAMAMAMTMTVDIRGQGTHQQVDTPEQKPLPKDVVKENSGGNIVVYRYGKPTRTFKPNETVGVTLTCPKCSSTINSNMPAKSTLSWRSGCLSCSTDMAMTIA